MNRIQAYRFQLMPCAEQQRQMRRFAGACRFVFNQALTLQKRRAEDRQPLLSYVDLCKCLTGWRHAEQTIWLREAPTHPLQQSLKDLTQAYANYFSKRTAHPRFKKKGQEDSFRYPDPKQIKLDQVNGRVFLPKLGWLRYRNSRNVQGTVKNITVRQADGHWYISILTEREEELSGLSDSMVGIDLGIVRFATLSDGTCYLPLDGLQKHEQALRRAHQALSRKTKFSHNWEKAKSRVQRCYTRKANARRDYLHKISTSICKNHAVVCMEDLQVRKLSRSAAGSIEVPGQNVSAKSRLNKAILDQGWREFRRQVEYKLAWRGGRLIAVPPQYTSQECPACHHVAKDNRKSQAIFMCMACGLEGNADLVGAINILRAGHARLACEVSDAGRSPATGTHRSSAVPASCSGVML